MKKGLAWLIFIVDRSGSMSSIASDMEEGIGSTIEKQKTEYDGETIVTVVLFDDAYEIQHNQIPIGEIGKISINPRGWTALLDAVGKTVTTIEQNFNALSEDDRPEKVLFVIVTDGHENHSKEYTRPQICEKIETAKKEHEWGVTFIGANQDALEEGSRIGVDATSTLNYAATSEGVRKMSRSMTNYVTSYFEHGEASYKDEEDDQT